MTKKQKRRQKRDHYYTENQVVNLILADRGKSTCPAAKKVVKRLRTEHKELKKK